MKIGLVYPQTELGGDPDAVRAMGERVLQGRERLLAIGVELREGLG